MLNSQDQETRWVRVLFEQDQHLDTKDGLSNSRSSSKSKSTTAKFIPTAQLNSEASSCSFHKTDSHLDAGNKSSPKEQEMTRAYHLQCRFLSRTRQARWWDANPVSRSNTPLCIAMWCVCNRQQVDTTIVWTTNEPSGQRPKRVEGERLGICTMFNDYNFRGSCGFRAVASKIKLQVLALDQNHLIK